MRKNGSKNILNQQHESLHIIEIQVLKLIIMGKTMPDRPIRHEDACPVEEIHLFFHGGAMMDRDNFISGPMKDQTRHRGIGHQIGGSGIEELRVGLGSPADELMVVGKQGMFIIKHFRCDNRGII